VPADWFRTPEWDADAQLDFERRLARSRPYSRSQYLRIKALALRDAGRTADAKRLLQRVIDEHPEALDAAHAAELLGDLAREAGELDEAVRRYEQTLELRPDLNATSGQAHISLAEVLNQRRAHVEALHALKRIPAAKLGLNVARFRWNAALAEAAAGVGERDVAKVSAERALALLRAPDQFARHPGVGRADASHLQEARLRALAGAEPARSGRRSWLRLVKPDRTTTASPDDEAAAIARQLSAPGADGTTEVERQLIARLGDAGVEVLEVSDLAHRRITKAAVPPLLEALENEEVQGILRELIVRALTDPAARPIAVQPLIREFQRAVDDNYRWVVGNALHTVADRSNEQELLDLARDRRYGDSRQMIVAKLGYMRSERSRDVLLDLLAEDGVDGQAVVALNRLPTALIADPRVVERVTSFTSDERDFVRKAAARLLQKTGERN
jgi:tetratricopeptide (TPR) repeat protein